MRRLWHWLFGHTSRAANIRIERATAKDARYGFWPPLKDDQVVEYGSDNDAWTAKDNVTVSNDAHATIDKVKPQA